MPTAPRQHRAHPPRPRVYDDRYRGTAAERGYDWNWAKVAAYVRERDCYLCQECKRHGRLVPAKTVDHIIPVHVKPDLRLDAENCEVLCVRHNTLKGYADARKYGRRV